MSVSTLSKTTHRAGPRTPAITTCSCRSADNIGITGVISSVISGLLPQQLPAATAAAKRPDRVSGRVIPLVSGIPPLAFLPQTEPARRSQHGEVQLAGPATAARPGRTSYAGLWVEVLERPDGELIVRYDGRRVATQEPPARMGALWAGATAWSPGPELRRVVSSVGDHHISRSQQRRLAALEPVRPAAPAIKPVASKEAAAKDAASKTSNPWTRTPTPTQLARWKAIQKGRLKGLSLRAISRELGISRVTVRKYAYAEKPPTKKLSSKERAKLMALRKSTAVAN